ncbi:MAG TPA: SDR family oxidoreductase [Jatrophihabitans sp.]
MSDAISTDSGTLLEGKVAVVTGAGSGIGAATARLFAAHGAHVIIAEIDPETAQRTADEIAEAGSTASVTVLDVREDEQVTAFANDVLAKHGAIDILINNVGHWLHIPSHFTKSDPKQWEELYRINLHHVFTMTYAFLPSMIERGKGSIVNVASVEGMRGYPADPVYGAFKAAVVHFTKGLGVQIGHQGVRVNVIGPDLTESVQAPYSKWITPEEGEKWWPIWAPVGRVGEPIDQARVVLFLASDMSSFITGHAIPTDGGSAAAGGWFRAPRRGSMRWTNRPYVAEG